LRSSTVRWFKIRLVGYFADFDATLTGTLCCFAGTFCARFEETTRLDCLASNDARSTSFTDRLVDTTRERCDCHAPAGAGDTIRRTLMLLSAVPTRRRTKAPEPAVTAAIMLGWMTTYCTAVRGRYASNVPAQLRQ